MKNITMRILILILSILITSNLYSQSETLKKITAEICDSLENSTKPLNKLHRHEAFSIMRKVLRNNRVAWINEVNDFKKRTGKTDYDFDAYFKHILQIDCENYRIVDKVIDSYLVDEKLRAHYLQTKKFDFALKDNLQNNVLKNFLNDSLHHTSIDSLLNICKKEINTFKRTTNVYIMQVGNYSFNIRYFDYLTTEQVFQIDIIYQDDTDLLIDDIIVKDKKQLKKIEADYQNFMKKVEKGEAEIPPPPVPSEE